VQQRSTSNIAPRDGNARAAHRMIAPPDVGHTHGPIERCYDPSGSSRRRINRYARADDAEVARIASAGPWSSQSATRRAGRGMHHNNQKRVITGAALPRRAILE
jgi:hypothetical protein